jgi:hypothetical protein
MVIDLFVLALAFLQFYPVEQVLGMCDRGSIKGTALIAKLKKSQNLDRQERIFLVKILGKYLMKNALV